MIDVGSKTLFVYPEGLSVETGDKYDEVQTYISEMDMSDLVTVAHDPYKDTIAITGPEELLRELYNDCVYVGDEEGFEEGFQNSVG